MPSIKGYDVTKNRISRGGLFQDLDPRTSVAAVCDDEKPCSRVSFSPRKLPHPKYIHRPDSELVHEPITGSRLAMSFQTITHVRG